MSLMSIILGTSKFVKKKSEDQIINFEAVEFVNLQWVAQEALVVKASQC